MLDLWRKWWKIAAGFLGTPTVKRGRIAVSRELRRTGYNVEAERKENRETLKALCESVVSNPDYKETVDEDGKKRTWCNRAFSDICEQFKGLGVFKNLKANTIHTLLGTLPGWEPERNPVRVHKHVERGGLAAAALPGDKHGHVVAVGPGPLVFSGNFGSSVPLVAHVGKAPNGIKGANYAFMKMPDWFLYRPDEV